jgi:hypothetical protein
MAARGIAGGEYALATSRMVVHKHAAVHRGVPVPVPLGFKAWSSFL